MGATVNSLYERITRAEAQEDRPFVTLTFAQSLDGSISARAGTKTTLSGEASLTMTHTLRSLHDGIMVGIGTVLADDPQLTVRGVDGSDPQPIIVDSQLRLPLDCRLLRSGRSPWIACSPSAGAKARARLQALGAKLLTVRQRSVNRLDLDQLFAELRAQGVRRLMVEGGARIIHSTLQRGLVDLLVITMTPRLLSGLRPYYGFSEQPSFPELRQPRWSPAGDDMIFWATVERG